LGEGGWNGRGWERMFTQHMLLFRSLSRCMLTSLARCMRALQGSLVDFENILAMEPRNYVGDNFSRVTPVYKVTQYNIACCYAMLDQVRTKCGKRNGKGCVRGGEGVKGGGRVCEREGPARVPWSQPPGRAWPTPSSTLSHLPHVLTFHTTPHSRFASPRWTRASSRSRHAWPAASTTSSRSARIRTWRSCARAPSERGERRG
jgi:hypothetical protein